MKKTVWIALFAIFFIALAVIGAGIYFYTLKPKDLEKVKPDFVMTSVELQKLFEENESVASARFINKIIEVSGEISSVKPGENNTFNVALKTGNELSSIICTFPGGSPAGNLKQGSRITIRGECSGYLMDVLLNNCTVHVSSK
jgi:hypothetical protein